MRCPRCFHETNHKNDMYKHLYKRNKLCELKNPINIELTDSVKQDVLNERLNNKNVRLRNNRNIIVNNYNIQNNDIRINIGEIVNNKNISLECLLNFYVKYQEKVLNDNLNKYVISSLRLNNINIPKYKNDIIFAPEKCVGVNDLVNIVKNCISSYRDNTILYSKGDDKFYIGEDYMYCSYNLDDVLLFIINSLKDIFLEDYEIYLIRFIINDDIKMEDYMVALYELRNIYKLYYILDVYGGKYRTIKPCIWCMTNNKFSYPNLRIARGFIQGSYDDGGFYSISNYFMNEFEEVCESMKKEKHSYNYILQDIIDRMKYVGEINMDLFIEDMNKLMNIDNSFKTLIMNI